MALKLIHEKHAINLPCELALIVKEIDGALNEIIATLGFKGYNVLIPNGDFGVERPCSCHSLFSWFVGHVFRGGGCISSFLLWTDLLSVGWRNISKIMPTPISTEQWSDFSWLNKGLCI